MCPRRVRSHYSGSDMQQVTGYEGALVGNQMGLP